MSFGEQGYALGNGEGESLWFFNTLMTVKAGGSDTKDAFTLIEVEVPVGQGPPPHIHRNEEEGFYILDGEVEITCGDQTWSGTAGAFALLPRGIAHAFQIYGDRPARMLQITSPAQFERFAAEMGEPAPTMTIPPPTAVDIDKLMRIVPRYGIEMLPPP